MATVKLTKKNFKKTIEENDFVIVDFWAPWCEPCVEFTPVFEAAADKERPRYVNCKRLLRESSQRGN